MKDIICLVSDNTDTPVKIVRWLKNVGDAVTKDEPVCEVSTDKATLEVFSPCNGVVKSIKKLENQNVSLGEAIGSVEDKSLSSKIEILNTSFDVEENSTGNRNQLMTPSVRRLIKEKGISIESVVGSGPGGRVLLKDVEAVQSSSAEQMPRTSLCESYFVPHTSMRTAIAKKVKASLQQVAPHVTAFFEVDLQSVLTHINVNKQSDTTNNVKRTITTYFVKAASLAIQDVPEVNSRWYDDKLEIYREHHIGIVTSLGSRGLVIPVVKNVERKSLFDIARDLTEIKRKRDINETFYNEEQNATFSISNYGSQSGLFTAPIIIPQPQSAVLGIGSMEYRIKANNLLLDDGGVVSSYDFKLCPMVYISLTIDHRVLDAYHTNRFMQKMVQLLETPDLMDSF
jgi:2-oxoglutarate dehydrogenase E2 component (dihydrolipoamide succinyltransferase)